MQFNEKGLELDRSGRTCLILWIWLVVLGGAALRLWGFVGFIGMDDLGYLKQAYNLAHSQYVLEAFPFSNRWGVLLPEALAFYVSGFRLLYVYPFALGLLHIYLAYLLGRLATGKEMAGVLSALVMATLPLHVRQSTMVLSDLPSAVFGALCFYMVLRAESMEGNRRHLVLFLAGLSLGWAYECKEMIVYTFPVLFVFFVREIRSDPRRIWSWAVFALGALIFPVAEITYYYLAAGDVMLRYQGVNYNQHAFPDCTSIADILGSGLYYRLFLELPDKMFTRFNQFTALFHLAVAGTAWAIASGKTRPRLLAIWLWLSLLIYNFISPSLQDYIPVLIVPRYILPIIAPAAALAGAVLYDLYQSLARAEFRRPAYQGAKALFITCLAVAIYNPVTFQFVMLCMASIILVALYGLSRGQTVNKNWRAAPATLVLWQAGFIVFLLLTPERPYQPLTRLYYQALDMVNREGPLPIYSDFWSVRIFQFMDEYKDPDRFVDFYQVTQGQISRGFVWREDEHLGRIKKYHDLDAPDFITYPPAAWRVVFERSYKDYKYILYRVGDDAPEAGDGKPRGP